MLKQYRVKRLFEKTTLFSLTGWLGLLILLLAQLGFDYEALPGLVAGCALVASAAGVIGYAYSVKKSKPGGLRNLGIFHRSLSTRGVAGWLLGMALTALYVILYFFPEMLGYGGGEAANTRLIGLFDPLSMALKGQPASQWFVYGVLYTFAVVVFGLRFLIKYRHNRYQVIRTLSVMFFQFGFAFLLPEILMRLQYPYYDAKNMWPLNYSFFDAWSLDGFLNSGAAGLLMLLFGLVMIFVISPVLTYFYGKRWYCSWVCGCGGLAETAGDPFRHLSSSSAGAWKLERWLIHSILVVVVIMTLGVLYSYFSDHSESLWVSRAFFVFAISILFMGLGIWVLTDRKRFKSLDPRARNVALTVGAGCVLLLTVSHLAGGNRVLFVPVESLRSWYGFLIGAIFSGVIGVGFYPILGSRVWCRFGCPMAAILGIQQRFFSRFRITTNGGQCISCGNCTTYCEMGIDVRMYAQRGEDILRASCVGCGICSEVCPRGVLRLENGPVPETVGSSLVNHLLLSAR